MEDVHWRYIKHFTKAEAIATGADPKDLSFTLVRRFDYFREQLGRPVLWLVNGLTTGSHRSKYHSLGMAGDCALREVDGSVDVVDVQRVFYCALSSGFKGIGIYHNAAAYSFHLDCRPSYGMWIGYKRHRELDWNYVPLLIDPANLSI